MKDLAKLLLLVLVIMEQDFVTTRTHKINGKTYLVPQYNIQGYEKFFLPKLEFKGIHHVYFNPDQINQIYKQQNIDPNNLECNLKYDPEKENSKLVEKIKEQKKASEVKKQDVKKEVEVYEENISEVKGRPKPPLREKGYTHFIHIPLTDACKETFQNVIKTTIDANDMDALVDLKTLHTTILVFRMKSEADLPKWKSILQSLKLRKVKITLRGVGIFPIKLNTNYTKVFYIKVGGVDDLIHEVVQKAIAAGLVEENQLSHITFDKKIDMYKQPSPHLTILKAKGQDIIDATTYLKQLNKLNISKPTFADIRLSMIGSFDGESYYDELILPVDK